MYADAISTLEKTQLLEAMDTSAHTTLRSELLSESTHISVEKASDGALRLRLSDALSTVEVIVMTHQDQADVSARNANAILEERCAAQAKVVDLRNRQASGHPVDEQIAVAIAIEAEKQKATPERRDYRQYMGPLLETVADQKQKLDNNNDKTSDKGRSSHSNSTPEDPTVEQRLRSNMNPAASPSNDRNAASSSSRPTASKINDASGRREERAAFGRGSSTRIRACPSGSARRQRMSGPPGDDDDDDGYGRSSSTDRRPHDWSEEDEKEAYTSYHNYDTCEEEGAYHDEDQSGNIHRYPEWFEIHSHNDASPPQDRLLSSEHNKEYWLKNGGRK